jgi:hypothetical protein
MSVNPKPRDENCRNKRGFHDSNLCQHFFNRRGYFTITSRKRRKLLFFLSIVLCTLLFDIHGRQIPSLIVSNERYKSNITADGKSIG